VKVQIAVRGRKYTVKSDEDGVDIQRIADYVDQRMAEVSSRAVGADEYTVAMLAALNIASDFERFRQQVDDEMASMDRELASTLVLLESVLPEDEPTMHDGADDDTTKS
jgi:cell division protein ZapA